MNHLIRGSDYLAHQPGFALVGRDADLARLTAVLMRDRASSVILSGAGGVGATALCLGLQVAKNAPEAPLDLVAKRFFWLDVNGLFGSDDPERVRRDFFRIVDRMRAIEGSVLVVEDARDLLEACRAGGNGHFLNALMGHVRAGGSQMILETRDDDLEVVLRAHSDLRELFTVFPVEEPRGADLRAIVVAGAARLFGSHGVAVGEDAIDAAIEVTTRYPLPGARAQPERALTLLDRALATYRLRAHVGIDPTTQARLRELQRDRRVGETAIERLEDELEERRARDAEAAEAVRAFASPEAEDLRRRVAEYQQLVTANLAEFNELTARVNAGLALGREDVLAEFSAQSGIPPAKLNQDETAKLQTLEEGLRRRIFGQDAVLRAVANGVKVARVGRRSGRPLPFLFLGPSGVGKTETAKALAAALLDDDAALTRFDMSEYMEKHAVAKLIGAPPGYEGYEAGGILTNAMRRNPYRVLLFDEIEKAHPDIFRIFLQVLSDGRLTDNVGRTVSFADAVIVMTTNLGQAHFLAGGDDAEASALAELAEAYPSELLNRFAGRQNILCFKPLGLDSIERIVGRELDALAATYSARGLVVYVGQDLARDICAERYDPLIGARGLPGFITAQLEPLLVDFVLQGIQGDVSLIYAEGRFTVRRIR